MLPRSDLEIKGHLFIHPFAELLAESAEAGLSGSLRLESKEHKCIVYLKSGRVVFATSNARSLRLFHILLDSGRITNEDLANVPDPANDLKLLEHLQASDFLSKAAAAALLREQVEAIIAHALSWTEGHWSFDSLKRIRDGLECRVNARKLLLDYGRRLPPEQMLGRFRSLDEGSRASTISDLDINLSPDEAFILSRLGDERMKTSDLIAVSGMKDDKALGALYTLWLAGLVVRDDRPRAFSEHIVTVLKNAKLSIKQEAKLPTDVSETKVEPPPRSEDPPAKESEPVVSLEEYLRRVENADTYYEILGVDQKADLAAIRKAYFGLARTFHPDKFHSEAPELLRRVQDAFTQMMQAHETLKTNETRDLYDYRMRKELANREKLDGSEPGGNAVQLEQAVESFERGFSLLMDHDSEGAVPFLARAVHYAPNVAKYRAYYGKALADDPKQRHKAEAEMQAAIKLDPQNVTYRLVLAEFFIQVNLLKRAEGELNRLLAIAPDNAGAQDLLAGLKAKA